MSYEKNETYTIVGDHSYGIERQVWEPGRHVQYAVAVPTPCPGAPAATTRTCVGTLPEARAIMDAVLPYGVVYLDERTEAAARSLGAAVALVADALGCDPRDLDLVERSSSCGTAERYEVSFLGDDERSDARAVISRDHDAAPPPGWVERAVERARREGVLPPTP